MDIRRSGKFSFFSTLGLWAYLRFAKQITSIAVSVDVITSMVWFAGWIMLFASSLSMVVQYRNESLGGNSAEIGGGPGRGMLVAGLLLWLCIASGSIIPLSQGEWTFAASFLMLLFAALYMSVCLFGKKPSPRFTGGDRLALNIVGWIALSLFVGLYIASICLTVLEYRAFGATRLLPRLFGLGFGALIFWLSVKNSTVGSSSDHCHENS